MSDATSQRGAGAGGYLIAAFEQRKAGMTVTDFKNYYDNVHVPLMRQQLGSASPLTLSRYYVDRKPGSQNEEPLVIWGEASDINYDVIAVMMFRDQEYFKEFQTKYADPAVAGPLVNDEEEFLEKSTLKVIGIEPPHVTSWE